MMGYHVIMDLEMCKVPKANKSKDYRWKQETIQIGAVLLNDNYEIVDQFSTYVAPEYGYVDSFINKLTGIASKDVIGAPKMAEAMKLFTDWIPAGDVEIVSWSNSDEYQIKHEMESKHISNARMEELLGNWNDCQVTFSGLVESERRYSLQDALIISDIKAEGREHDGLADAYNTALLYAKMSTEETFTFNKEYESARFHEVEHLSCTLGDMFPVLCMQLAS